MKVASGLMVLAAWTLCGCETLPHPESQTPYELGRDAAKMKDYATAVTQLTVAINNARDYVFTEAYFERGECYLQMAMNTEDPPARDQHLQLALEDFNHVLKSEELGACNNSRANVLIGRTFMAKLDFKAAEQAFRKVLEFEVEPSARESILAAHRDLGWILLEAARTSLKPDLTAEEEIKLQEEFRKAQEHFSRGLEIHDEDEECNLGKGICLHCRGQDGEAIRYLRKSTDLSESRNSANPRGHYYLALALELQHGYQDKALEHYRRAVEQDSRQSFTQLYNHLVKVLLVYVPFEAPQFRWFFDNMLAFTGGDRTYWSNVEEFAGGLIEGRTVGMKEAGFLARAVARARNLKVDAAVSDALLLSDQPDFLQLLIRIFPNQPRRAESLYGRALTLFGSKRHKELANFFKEPAFETPDPALTESEYFQKALVIDGRNILALWLERGSRNGPLTVGQKTERDSYLSRAIAAFQTYLTSHPDDREVALALGGAQEETDDFSKASVRYAELGKKNPADDEVFRRLVRLHTGRLLNPQQMTDAWVALLRYAGNDPEIREYVQRQKDALVSQITLYCRGCGRKGSEGDVLCLECGKQIGVATAPLTGSE